MPNICTTNYVIEGEKKELDALYQTMKEQQENNLGCLVKALGKNPEEVECRGVWTDLERQGDILRVTFETAWTPCYEVTTLLKEAYPSLRIFYKAEEPGCCIYLKNDAEGKYFPETETDGHPYELMTEEREQAQVRLIRGIKDGSIKVNVTKEKKNIDELLAEIGRAPMLSEEEEQALIKAILEKGPECEEMEKLILPNMRFVVSVANQYKDKGLSLEELIEAGTEGLRKAALKYDLKADYKFMAYAVWWIRQAMIQVINEKG